jgi:phage terminase large subunit-like protein
MSAREQPLLIGITTAGFDRGSLAWRLYEYGRRIAAGEVDDPSFFFRWWEPPRGADWKDEAAWAAANPALGDFLHLSALRDDAKSTPEHEFRRYHLNQWTTTRDAWLPHGAWEAIADPKRVVDPETPCVLFFDGSWTGDSTGIAGMTLEERPHLFVVDAWEPSETGRHVERSDVERAIYKATEDHRVSYIGADPHEWRGELQKWYDDGLPIVEWPTNAVARMVEACGEFYRGVMTKAFTHDGDPRLLRHITNAVVKVDRIGARIVKNSSREKIDLAVCAVGAYDLVLRHRDEDFSDATVTLLD